MRHGPLPGAGMMGSTGDPSLQGDPEAPAGGATLAGDAFHLVSCEFWLSEGITATRCCTPRDARRVQ